MVLKSSDLKKGDIVFFHNTKKDNIFILKVSGIDYQTFDTPAIIGKCLVCHNKVKEGTTSDGWISPEDAKAFGYNVCKVITEDELFAWLI